MLSLNWNITGYDTGSTLFKVTLLPKPKMTYDQLDNQEKTVKFEIKHKTFGSTKCSWKCYLPNVDYFVQAFMCEFMIILIFQIIQFWRLF